jgi:topoisomerase-4 subunit A
MIEREPITVVVSRKGWIRALKGQVADLSTLTYKGDDKLGTSFFTETTSKILVVATNGKVFTLEASKLPGGRGAGEPVRLMADIDEGEEIMAVFPYEAGAKVLIAGSDARGFVVGHDELLSSTRKGKAVLTIDPPGKATHVAPAVGDHVAIIGENRKLLVFPLNQVPELARGKGVRLQKYRDGGIADVKTFPVAEGLTWKDSAGRLFTLLGTELRDWLGNRAETGRLPPKGFPRNNKFVG